MLLILILHLHLVEVLIRFYLLDFRKMYILEMH